MINLKVKSDLALEALTIPSHSAEEPPTDQIMEGSRGLNYERLELLGDCFLKMAASISLFTKNPDGNEFEYHVSRMVMICNKNLLKTALDVKLYQYVRSTGFSR